MACTLGGSALAAPARAQQSPLTARVTSGEWIGRSTPLELRVSRPLQAATERLAVFAGTRDLSPQLETAGDGVTFRVRVGGGMRHLALSPGTHELVVWRVVDDSVWTEMFRAPIRVEGVLGTRERKRSGSAQLGLKSRFRTDAPTAAPSGDRSSFHDLDGTFGFDLGAARRDVRVASRGTMVGTSHRPAALRYAGRGDDAPLLDLASYLVQAAIGRTELSLGRQAAGSHRYLLNGFASRGAGLRLARSRIMATASALHGSDLVGWNDLLGFTLPDHRLLSGTLALEALPTPGALRLEVSALDGSVRPVTGYSQGAVADAERSEGLGVRVQSALLQRRLRVDGGVARSTFDVRADAQIGADSLVPTNRETREARYLEAAADLLRGRHLWGARTASLSIGSSYARVDPLYRSVGTYVQSDRLQRRVDARGDIAGLGFGFSHDRGEDNLADIPSLLKTRSRQSALDVTAPVATLLGVANRSQWFPTIGLRANRTVQRGAGVPVGGGFDASHVPDQLSIDHTVSVVWQLQRATFSAQRNASEQDNRQPGRERADLHNSTWSAQLALTAHRLMSFGVDAGWSRARAVERDEVERVRRWATSVNLFPAGPVPLVLQYSTTTSRTPKLEFSREDSQFSAQLSATLPGPFARGGRWFLRFAGHRQRFGTASDVNRRGGSTLDGGLTLTMQ